METLLKELKVGDHFYHASQKIRTTPIFEVVGVGYSKTNGKVEVLRCKNLDTGKLVNKLGKLKIVKVKS